jgi:hypothetical protein
MKATYTIHYASLPHALEQLAEYAARTRRLGMDAPTFEVSEVRFLQADGEPEAGPEAVQVVDVTVTGERPMIQGWAIVARLDHRDAGNIVRNVSGEELPLGYRTSAPTCDHCHTNRARTSTVVIRNIESGEYRQVGHQCLSNYLGTTEAQVNDWLDLSDGFLTDADLLDLRGGTEWYDAAYVLAAAAAAISVYHWVSSTEAQDDFRKTATKTYVMDIYHGRDKKALVTEDDKELARLTAQWVRESTDGGEYIANLKVLVGADPEKPSWVTPRDFGTLTSAIPSFKRALEQALYAVSAPSRYQGTVGDKIAVEVVVTSLRVLEEWRYTTYLYKLQDQAGNIYVWFASRKTMLEDGHYSVVGTVKEHSAYRGIEQTVLTRCKAEQIDPWVETVAQAIEGGAA